MGKNNLAYFECKKASFSGLFYKVALCSKKGEFYGN